MLAVYRQQQRPALLHRRQKDFATQHKAKQNPSMHASCCEGQGTRRFGSLPEFVFSIVGSAADKDPQLRWSPDPELCNA